MSSTLFPQCVVLSKEEPIFHVRAGGSIQVQLVVCCNQRRDRLTEDLSPLSSAPSPPLHCCQISKTWQTNGIEVKYMSAAISGNNMIEFTLGFFLSKCFKWKISGPPVLWLVKCIPVSPFGILPLGYLQTRILYLCSIFPSLSAVPCTWDWDECLLNYIVTSWIYRISQ